MTEPTCSCPLSAHEGFGHRSGCAWMAWKSSAVKAPTTKVALTDLPVYKTTPTANFQCKNCRDTGWFRWWDLSEYDAICAGAHNVPCPKCKAVDWDFTLHDRTRRRCLQCKHEEGPRLPTRPKP